MTKFTIVLLIFILGTILLVTAISFNSISCYRYAMTRGINSTIDDFFTMNGSCRAEKEPKGHLTVSCEEWYKTSKNASYQGLGISEFPKVSFSCIKRTYDGWLVSSGRKAKVTIRSCIGLFDSDDPLPDGCYRYRHRYSKPKYSRIGEAEDVEVSVKDFDADTSVEVCICNTNECNGALQQQGGITVIPILLGISITGVFSFNSNFV